MSKTDFSYTIIQSKDLEGYTDAVKDAIYLLSVVSWWNDNECEYVENAVISLGSGSEINESFTELINQLPYVVTQQKFIQELDRVLTDLEYTNPLNKDEIDILLRLRSNKLLPESLREHPILAN